MQSPVYIKSSASKNFRNGHTNHIIFLSLWLVLYLLSIYLGSAYYTWTDTANDRLTPGERVSNFLNERTYEFALLSLKYIFVLFPLVVFIFYINSRKMATDEKNILFWYGAMLIFIAAMICVFVGMIFVAAGCNSVDAPYNVCRSPYYCCKYANTPSCPNDYLCPGYDVDAPLYPQWWFVTDFVFVVVMLITLFIFMVLYDSWIFKPSRALNAAEEAANFNTDLQPLIQTAAVQPAGTPTEPLTAKSVSQWVSSSPTAPKPRLHQTKTLVF